jgi:hypothetical protein
MARGGDGDGEGDGLGCRTFRSTLRTRICSTDGADGSLVTRSIILSRTWTGDGDRSRTLSRVSITRARSLSGGGEGDLRSTILVEVLTRSAAGGLGGDLSIIRSRILTGEGDRGLRSSSLVKVSISRSLSTNCPGSCRP